jgi:ABC-2 type transport system permease protein
MIRPIKAIVVRSLIKLSRDRMRLFFLLFMSVMFLFIFSFVTKSVITGLNNPTIYLISGIIIMNVFQTSLSNSMSILDDISNGFMKEIIVAPIKRWQIALGQIFSSTIIAVVQSLVIVIIGLFLGLKFDLVHGILMALVMILIGLTFSSIGLFFATLAKESTNFQLLINIISFPLTFLSGAYIPTMIIPSILLPVVFLNPLTYTTAAFRYVSLQLDNLSIDEMIKMGVAFKVNGFIIQPFVSVIMILIIGTIFFILCVRKFEKADFSKVKALKHGHG